MSTDISARMDALVKSFVEKTKRLAFQVAQEALASFGREPGPRSRPSTQPANGGSRRRRSAADLDQRSGEFLGFVTQNPGLRMEEIKAALGLTTKDLQLPVRKLLRHRAVRVEGRLRGTRYYAT